MIIRPACMEALLDMGKALGRVEEHMDRVLGEDASKEWQLADYWAGRLRAQFDEMRELCPPSKYAKRTDSPEDRLDNNLPFLYTAFRVKDLLSAQMVFNRLEGYLVEWIDDMVFGQPERVARSRDAVTR